MPKWCHAIQCSCNSPTTPGYVYVSFTDRGFDPTETWFPLRGDHRDPDGRIGADTAAAASPEPELEDVAEAATQPDFCVNRQGTLSSKSNQGQTKTDLTCSRSRPVRPRACGRRTRGGERARGGAIAGESVVTNATTDGRQCRCRSSRCRCGPCALAGVGAKRRGRVRTCDRGREAAVRRYFEPPTPSIGGRHPCSASHSSASAGSRSAISPR